jgi:hypothetical protein
VNTFDELGHDALLGLSSRFPPIYSAGPLNLLHDRSQNDYLSLIGSSLWKEETECLQWLDTKESDSVVYENFGSITVMAPQQLAEFAWRLSIMRPDLVRGDSVILLHEFL